ncbi:hypothetical protein GCM10029992_33320 [Glycomyces albus]
MTVSRTLAGGRNVRPDVQERVMAAVRELGYYRNENARSLRPGQPSGLVGVAITNLANPYYGNFALGVEEVAAEHGRRIILGNSGEDAGRERQLVSDFIGRQVDGLILVPTSGDAEHLRPERLGEVPLVLASRRVPGLEVDTVLLDDVGGSYRGTVSCWRPATPASGSSATAARCSPVRDGTRAMSGRCSRAGCRSIRRSSRATSRTWPPRAGPPRRCSNSPSPRRRSSAPTTATRSAPCARSGGGSATASGPRPAVVSFDDFELSELMPVPVTIIDHDAQLLGREAARLLFARLDGSADGAARTVELPVSIEFP